MQLFAVFYVFLFKFQLVGVEVQQYHTLTDRLLRFQSESIYLR